MLGYLVFDSSIISEHLEFLDMTLHISPGGSGVELVRLAALINKSEGGSGSRSADIGTSSAVSSWTSSISSPNACIKSCKNAFCDL
jgi:hypothetical protein